MKVVEDADQSTLKHLRFEFLKFSPTIYYHDVVTVTLKGQERELEKILTIFTSIDFSCNMFAGPIPKEMGELRALHVLNLSGNALTGNVPSFIGNLQQLESLDLSSNNLSGSIPASITNLNFLSFLNLSFNHLIGNIPTGTQIQTFSAASFAGNDGLCGPPLPHSCSSPSKATDGGTGNTDSFSADSFIGKIDWHLLSAEIGFIFGFGFVIAPLMFYKSWRIRYFDNVDVIVIRIFPSSVSRKWFRWTN